MSAFPTRKLFPNWKCCPGSDHLSNVFFQTVEKLMKLADGDKAAAAAVLTLLEEAFWDAIDHQGIKR